MFGHLRFVPQNESWLALFEAARTVNGSHVSVLEELPAAGANLGGNLGGACLGHAPVTGAVTW